jgi:hypothetical protein
VAAGEEASAEGMKRRLIIEPEAEADLRKAFRWYQEQREALGDQFLLAVEAMRKRHK